MRVVRYTDTVIENNNYNSRNKIVGALNLARYAINQYGVTYAFINIEPKHLSIINAITKDKTEIRWVENEDIENYRNDAKKIAERQLLYPVNQSQSASASSLVRRPSFTETETLDITERCHIVVALEQSYRGERYIVMRIVPKEEMNKYKDVLKSCKGCKFEDDRIYFEVNTSNQLKTFIDNPHISNKFVQQINATASCHVNDLTKQDIDLKTIIGGSQAIDKKVIDRLNQALGQQYIYCAVAELPKLDHEAKQRQI